MCYCFCDFFFLLMHYVHADSIINTYNEHVYCQMINLQYSTEGLQLTVIFIIDYFFFLKN